MHLQVAMNPTNTVFDAKRLIGRRFNDPSVQADMKHFSYTVIDKENKPMIQVEFKGETKVRCYGVVVGPCCWVM